MDMAIISHATIGTLESDSLAQLDKETAESRALQDVGDLKPLAKRWLNVVGKSFDKIITIEDGALMGGMGTAILEYMEDNGWNPRIKRLGLPDQFVPHGSPNELYRLVGLDKDSIKQAVRQLLADPTLAKS